jgi:hypothetical protein
VIILPTLQKHELEVQLQRQHQPRLLTSPSPPVHTTHTHHMSENPEATVGGDYTHSNFLTILLSSWSTAFAIVLLISLDSLEF